MVVTETSEGPPRSRRNTWIVVGIVLVVGAVAVISAMGSVTMTTATESFSGVSIIQLDLDNSPVVVRAGNGEEVSIEKRFTTGWFGGSTRSEQDGGELRLIQRCPPFFGFGCRARYEITVPGDVAVAGETSNGSIELTGLVGPIDVGTSNGAIRLDALSGPISVETSNGEITGAALASAQMDASTSNGRVELTFTDAPTSLVVDTSNGSVEVVVPEDSPPFALTTDTSNGDVVAGIRTDPAATDSIEISTSNGDITVRFP